MASVGKVTTTGTGEAVDWVTLGPGDHFLYFIWAGSAGIATPIVRAPGTTTYIDVKDNTNTVISITTNDAIRVGGGQEYSVDVGTHTSAVSVTAVKCE